MKTVVWIFTLIWALIALLNLPSLRGVSDWFFDQFALVIAIAAITGIAALVGAIVILLRVRRISGWGYVVFQVLAAAYGVYATLLPTPPPDPVLGYRPSEPKLMAAILGLCFTSAGAIGQATDRKK